MSKRIYIVRPLRDGPKARLVRAANNAQALRHVALDTLTAEVASQDDLVRLVGQGAKVEEAGADGGGVNPSSV
jgi:hypothetical protein